MARNWKVGNIDRDGKPEFHLETSNPVSDSDLFVLFSALKGYYGVPYIKGGVEQEEDGMATSLIIAFGKGVSEQKLSIDKSLDNIEIIPYWSRKKRVVTYIQNHYSYDTGNVTLAPLKRVKTFRQKLFFNVPFFDFIKDYSPEIVIEKYTHSKGDNNGFRNQSISGFKKAPLISSLPLTGQKSEIDFRQEEFFRLSNWTVFFVLKAKGHRKKSIQVHTFVQFKIRLLINGVAYETSPLLRLKMEASYHAIPMEGTLNRPDKPDNPDGPVEESEIIPGNAVLSYRII